jgi:hypothetical protein
VNIEAIYHQDDSYDWKHMRESEWYQYQDWKVKRVKAVFAFLALFKLIDYFFDLYHDGHNQGLYFQQGLRVFPFKLINYVEDHYSLDGQYDKYGDCRFFYSVVLFFISYTL